MTIREIEALSGMTRANIRFYETEGLLNPARWENGYRDYSEEDLEILRRIRLFRTLQFSLTQIKALQNGDEPLSLVLEKHLQELSREQKELDRAGETCRVMREEQAEFDTLDAQRYLDLYERVVRLPVDESLTSVGISGLHEDVPVSTGTPQSQDNESIANEITGKQSNFSEMASDMGTDGIHSTSGLSKEKNRAIDEYARTLEQPSWMKDDTAEPVRAPWRRFFARQLDLAVYGFCLNAILMLVFHINPERISSETQIGNFTFSVAWLSILALVIMLFVEPLFLAVFATTPGKWIMGFRVTDNDGCHLSYQAAFSRTWTVLWRGCGLGIPPFVLYRSWKSYRDCSDGVPLDWEYDAELTQKDEGVWRIAALVCAFLLLYGAENLVSLEATMPRYRGDLTAEEFYANYNQLASWYGLLDSAYSLGSDGHWWNSADVAVATEINSITVYLGSGPYFLDSDLTEKDDVVTGVSFHYETTDSTLYVQSYQEQMLLTTMSFACAQKGFGVFSTARRQILNVVSSYPQESFHYSCNGITVDCQVEYSGYMMLPYEDVLAPGEEPSYSMTFTITKDA